MQQSSTSSGIRSNGVFGDVQHTDSYAPQNLWKGLQQSLDATDLDVANAIVELERDTDEEGSQ